MIQQSGLAGAEETGDDGGGDAILEVDSASDGAEATGEESGGERDTAEMERLGDGSGCRFPEQESAQCGH